MSKDITSSEWIGEVPEEWHWTRIKRIASMAPSFSNGKPHEEDICTVVRMEAVSEYGSINTENQAPFYGIISGLNLFENGDVIFAKITPCMENGKGAFVENLPNQYAFGSTEFHVLRPEHKADGKFLYYYTFNPTFRAWAEKNMHGAAGQQRVSAKFLKYSHIPLPPLDEQKRIASYLDTSCATIDQALEAKKKQLEVLDDLRKSIIQKAITQGLKPDVKMKNSGIDWLGDIPKHWRVARIKRHVKMIRGKFSHRPRNDPAIYDGPYPFIQTGSIASTEKYITEYSQTLNSEGLAVSRMFPIGTIVMSIAANIGDVAIMDFEACFPDSIIGFVPDFYFHPDYLFYLLKSMKPVMLRSAIITTQLNINYVRIGSNYCPIPPYKEQEAIAQAIDKRIVELRRLSDTLTDQIKLLTTYQKSLIHECITGKRRINQKDLAKVGANV